jgi:hypothetical protein
MPDTGFFNGTAPVYLKAAFSDFLKLRHGGTNNIFSFQNERPFRSLSYPDINYTLMRPATAPPTNPTPNPNAAGSWPTGTWPYPSVASPSYRQDPGVKNVYHSATVNTAGGLVLPPPIPTRRLFQVPDATTGSHASGIIHTVGGVQLTGDPRVNIQPITAASTLTHRGSSLINTATTNLLLGGNTGKSNPDMRQHPYFRSEWLQKMMNLTTVRTHQYAVWITVGFFEVTQVGNADLVDQRPDLAYDRLGREIGLNGRPYRSRGFFILDRTRAVGFNAALPGTFRDVVVYSHVLQ